MCIWVSVALTSDCCKPQILFNVDYVLEGSLLLELSCVQFYCCLFFVHFLYFMPSVMNSHFWNAVVIDTNSDQE